MQEEASKTPSITAMVPKISPRLEDIVGKSKEFVEDFKLYQDSAGIFSSMGVSAPSTYLLEGVPGTGKTFGIHALNNTYNMRAMLKLMNGEEAKVDDFDLVVFEYSIGHHGTPYINQGSRNVQAVFDYAGMIARIGKPVLLFIDEADAVLGARGSSMQSHAEDNKVLETIMKNLQLAHDTPNFNVALATNTPGACDEASLRAGRIDKKYTFKLPNMEERVAAYNSFIHKSCQDAGYKVIRQFDSEELAEMSDKFSYADMRQTVDAAVIQRAKELALTSEKGIITAGYVTQKRLKEAALEHRKSFVKKAEKKSIGF